jgi:hypothetical protein
MYVCIRGGPQKPALAPRPLKIYCAYCDSKALLSPKKIVFEYAQECSRSQIKNIKKKQIIKNYLEQRFALNIYYSIQGVVINLDYSPIVSNGKMING